MTDVADATAPGSTDTAGLDHEVVVIGAGVAGLYQIKRLIDLGVDAIVLEGEDDLGGTWYKNRYPGSRFDSESYTYGYSWSRELLEEWHWVERFSPQPETLRYLNFVADKFGLRPHIRFGVFVDAMVFDEDGCFWRLHLRDGSEVTTRFVLTAIGVLSVPTYPKIEGMDSFEGPSFHTFDWPAEPVDLTGKRVAVIGTGATAIQLIPEVAKQAAELVVYQRRPNWAAPLNNGPISEEEMADIRRRYDEIFARCRSTAAGFEHDADRRGFYNVSRAERLAFWDRLYDGPGFGIWLQNFLEIFLDEQANAEFSEYIAERIRQRVDDKALAEKLIPRDHGFGIQRVPLETKYFEAYNRDNVTLVDLTETPIERITPQGIRTTAGERSFDLIVYATGFDAFTGAFDRMDITGVGGQKLRDKWKDGPVTYLGLLVAGFPNLVMLAGPQIAATNFPRAIEPAVDWATDLLQHVRAGGHHRFEADAEAEGQWLEEVARGYQMVLSGRAQSWITGYNSNLAGHEYGKTRYNVYQGGAPRYLARLQRTAEEGYPGVRLD
ncbi:MAG: flavin-containing monooxygenase [Acidimicrobiia bacterium]